MSLQDLQAQCGAFLMWTTQDLSRYSRVEMAFRAIEMHVGIDSLCSYQQMRDNLHLLFEYASDGDYPHAASYLYGWYVHYARLLLGYWMYS